MEETEATKMKFMKKTEATKMKTKVLSLMIAMAMLISVVPSAFAANDRWEGEMDAAGVATANGVYYDTVQEAVDNADGTLVTMLQNSEETVNAKGDLYLNLNGKSLAALNVTDGTLYGMDSTTNDYDCTDGYGKIASVTGTYAQQYKTDITGSTKRYLAVTEDSGLSFHRVYVGITKISLAPSVTGFGYKAEFYADTVALTQISAIGYSLSLGEGNPVTRSTGTFKNTLTLRLKNFDVANYGETAVNASATVTLLSGEVIESTAVSYSMRNVVEKINTLFADYTSTQKTAVQTMCKQHEAAMANWSIADILNWEE